MNGIIQQADVAVVWPSTDRRASLAEILTLARQLSARRSR